MGDPSGEAVAFVPLAERPRTPTRLVGSAWRLTLVSIALVFPVFAESWAALIVDTSASGWAR